GDPIDPRRGRRDGTRHQAGGSHEPLCRWLKSCNTAFKWPFDSRFMGVPEKDMAANFSKYADNSRDLARDLWRKLRAVAAHVPFAEDAVAIYYCSLDRATPVRVRMAILGALAYFVLPTDAIPDFLPIAGFTDDAAVLAATLQ